MFFNTYYTNIRINTEYFVNILEFIPIKKHFLPDSFWYMIGKEGSVLNVI